MQGRVAPQREVHTGWTPQGLSTTDNGQAAPEEASRLKNSHELPKTR